MHFEYDSEDVFQRIRNLQFGELKATFEKRTFDFITPGKTSRGTMRQRESWFLRVSELENPSVAGIGECAPLPGLSVEQPSDAEDKLIDVCLQINDWERLLDYDLRDFPSVRFALEQALLDLENGGRRILFSSKFTEGNELIRINGLVWMGNAQYMIDQINEKIKSGFRCLKLKIGGLAFDDELIILREIRENFGYDDLEIRLDANGAFTTENALERLDELAEFSIHSIEQPIPAGNWEEMAELCRLSPIPVALDEELIGIEEREQREEMLDIIMPSYIILKPSLNGGFCSSEEWIDLAEQRDISWWVTSSLESAIGLNALAQWTFKLQNPMYQGLGTGKVFSNNFESPLYLDGEHLMFDPSVSWQTDL